MQLECCISRRIKKKYWYAPWTTNAIVSKERSGATEHYLKFHGQLNWLHLLKIKTKPERYKRKVMVTLKIQKTTCMTKRLKPRRVDHPLSKQHIGTTFCQDIRKWNQYIDFTSDLQFLFCQFSLNEVEILRFEIKNKISM